MSKVSADQADKVRECLNPVRQILLAAMDEAVRRTSAIFRPTVHILSPHEERVMKVLGTTRGLDGMTGREVPTSTILERARLSEIRYRATMRMLQTKILANDSGFPTIVGEGLDMKLEMVPVVSLWEDGEEYVLRMGYAK